MDSISYYQKNKERRKLYNKEYKQLNKEILRIKKKEYDIIHKDEILRNAKQRRLNNIEKYRERERTQKKKNPTAIRHCNLKKFYGITIEIYNEMYKRQQGKCAICGRSYKSLCVDHNHNTGVIRGLLCYQCNLMLGNSKDCIDILSSAIIYLRDNGAGLTF
jgi:hypothetical protein